MKARLLANLIAAGDTASNYLRLVRGPRRHPTVEALDAPGRGEAQAILETIHQQNQPDELDINIEGKVLIKHMDQGLEDFGVVPYWYSEIARSRGEGIYPGVSVIIAGDPLRIRYRTMEVSFSRRATRITDEKNEFILPWEMVVPVEGQEKDRPYWFTTLARDRGDDLEIGDYVEIDGIPDKKYELMDIFWEYGDVEVRKVGSHEYQGMPWRHVRPWEE